MLSLLVIGDTHIPRRATEVPPQIIKKLTELTSKKLFDYTFFTGDLVKADDVNQYLKLKTKNDVFMVIGNMDYYEGNRNALMYQKLETPLFNDTPLTIGLTHGHQISPRGDHDQLESLAEERGYNILISGHTHKEDVFLTKKGILLLNPGSVTGAWSFVASGIPSFILLNIDTQQKNIIPKLFQYDLKSFDIKETSYYFKITNNKVSLKY